MAISVADVSSFKLVSFLSFKKSYLLSFHIEKMHISTLFFMFAYFIGQNSYQNMQFHTSWQFCISTLNRVQWKIGEEIAQWLMSLLMDPMDKGLISNCFGSYLPPPPHHHHPQAPQLSFFHIRPQVSCRWLLFEKLYREIMHTKLTSDKISFIFSLAIPNCSIKILWS